MAFSPWHYHRQIHEGTPAIGLSLTTAWRSIKNHGPIMLGLILVVFLAFGRLTTGDFWHQLDFQILVEAHGLAANPWAMFKHIGAWFNQPLLQLAFLFEYRAFGLDYGGYITINLLLHALNAFIVYMLVNLLFYRERLALLAAILFALCVGSYGRNLQTVHNLESLLLTFLHLLVLYLFIRNDYRREGRIFSSYFWVGLVIYSLTGLTKASTLSLLVCLVAYKAFFYEKRERRPIFSNDLLIFLALGLLFQYGQARWVSAVPAVVSQNDGPLHYTVMSALNVFRYLNLMVFPLQESTLLKEAGPLVQVLYDLRIAIRSLLSLSVISYSFFGFVFGSRPLRFFIAWTYLTIIPFSSYNSGENWLDLSHLYLASLGFCVILSSASMACMRLLGTRRWRRLLPMTVPLLFVVTALTLTYRLDHRNRATAATPRVQALKQETVERIQEPPIRLETVD